MNLVFRVIIFSIMLLCNTAEASRKVPEVKPLIYNDVKYTATIDTIEAWDINSNAKLWDLRIYTRDEFYKQNIRDELDENESDTWIYIDSLRIEGGRLVVGNELGEEYEVDLATKEVKKRIKDGLGILPAS